MYYTQHMGHCVPTNEYASKGVAGTGLGLGIAGTALSLLAGNGGNILGGIFGGGNATRELAAKDAEIAELRTEVKLRDANIYTDQKLADVFERLSGRINCVEAQIGEQRAYNAANNATLGCIQGQIAQLFGLTKLVVPNTSVCPGWGNVTITPSTTPTT
jgi:hypothetical protein